MKYFFAYFYQELKRKRPVGNGYFNFCGSITFVLLINIITVLTTIKVWLHKDYMPKSNGAFWGWASIWTAVIVAFIRAIFPLNEMSDIEVDPKDITKNYWLFFSFFMLSILILMIVMFQLIPKATPPTP
jgi:NADH:ubiquinone oxidoreductase subunit 6 (subunit J)